MIVRLVGAVILVAVLLLLLVMPWVLYPHPGVNEGIELAAVGPLLYVLTLGATLLSFLGVGLMGWKSEAPVGLGVFLLGVAGAFVLAIVAFGNFSDDRFLPLFFSPMLAVPFGIILVAVGLSMKARQRGNPWIGVLRGAVAAASVAVWLLLRGAADWLQAPYGFDVYGAITVAAISVVFFPTTTSKAVGVTMTGSDSLTSRSRERGTPGETKSDAGDPAALRSRDSDGGESR